MNLFRAIGTAMLVSVLVGCISTNQEEQPTVSGDGRDFAFPRPMEQFTYRSGAVTYRLQTINDGILRARVVAINVEAENGFTGAPSEEALVQNVIRDAFRANNICEAGTHPGLLNFGYAFNRGLGIWVARVRCSETLQANV